MTHSPEALQYVLNNISLLTKRDFILEIFTVTDRLKMSGSGQVKTAGRIYAGKLVQVGDFFHAVTAFEKLASDTYDVTLESTNISSKDIETTPLLDVTTPVLLPGNLIANYTDEKPLETTIGRVVMNYILLALPFGSIFSYINEKFNIGKIESMLFDAASQQQITSAQINTYANHLYYIGHMTEVSVPVYTEKSLGTDPNIHKRREELLKQYAKEIAAGDATVMSKIEQELIAMDKAFLKDDPSMLFYDKNASKSFNVQRKKMFLAGGMTERFGDAGTFDFNPTSLEEGVNVKNMAIIANEIRSASYSRALSTADAGVLAKEFMRALQNVKIVEDDCGTKNTVKVFLKSSTANLYLNRFVMQSGKTVEITPDTLHAFTGKEVNLRSPMTCQSHGGYCYTCMGKLFKTLDQESLTMRALAFSGFLLTIFLKRSHGLAFNTIEIKDLNTFTY